MWFAIAGCFHAGLHVRGGELLPPGAAGLEADATPLTVAPASVDIGDDTVTATFGARQMLHPIFALFLPPYSVGGGLRVGLARGLEGTLNLATQEATLGLRLALAPRVALSGSGGVYPTVFPLRANPRGTLTVDGSWRRVRWSLGGSAGEQVYVGFLPARLTPPCGSFGQTGCGEYSPGASINARRFEVRALGALGFEVPTSTVPDQIAAVTFAVAPWLTAWSPGPDELSVTRPEVPRPTDLRTGAGASLLVGLRWGPYGGRDDEP